MSKMFSHQEVSQKQAISGQIAALHRQYVNFLLAFSLSDNSEAIFSIVFESWLFLWFVAQLWSTQMWLLNDNPNPNPP